jgi:dipeptidyl aminopeptidase/acylaminoacyl peptidase
MRDIVDSLMPAIDKLIADGLVDGERMGIMGHSFGCYSTLSVIVQTQRFKAAVVSSGMSDLISAAFTQMKPDGSNWSISFFESLGGKLGASLWKERQRWIDNSPLFFFDRVTTPVLVVHGAADTNTAAHLGDETFLALRHLGKQVELAKYLDEDHVLFGRANTIDYANRMIRWFDAHLKAQAPK